MSRKKIRMVMERMLSKGMLLVVPLFAVGAPTFADGWQAGLNMPLARTATRAAKDNQGRIYIPGGILASVVQASVMRFDEAANSWEVLAAELSVARQVPGVASDRLGRIYVIGGSNNSGILASVDRFDPNLPDAGWSLDAVPPLPSPRLSADAVTDSRGIIYVVGGLDGAGVLAEFLMFDPDQSESGWTILPEMNSPRRQFGLVIDNQDRIYAVGGDDGGIGGTPQTDTVERYDLNNPDAGWVFVDSINSSRQVGVAVADCQGFIYAIGGWEPGYTCKVERFDPVAEAWEDIDPINQCRANIAGILGESGRLYAFGGDSGFTSQTTVEFLDIPECPTTEELLEKLVTLVLDLNLQNGIENSLDSKLDAALGALDDLNENNDAAACGSIGAFINAVDNQRGTKIPEADAVALIAAAEDILSSLGCS